MAEVEVPHPDEMHEKAENPFTRTVALFVATYAVGLAIATFGGHNVTKEMMILKQEESQTESTYKQNEMNEWSQFQAKASREAQFRIQLNMLEEEAKDNPQGFAQYKHKLMKFFRDEEGRMKADKKELSDKALQIRAEGAEKLKKLRESFATYQRKDPYFDFAEVIFQIAIVLASVAMLSEKKWAFLLSLSLAVIGTILTLNGFTLLMAIPFLDGGSGH